MQRKSGQPGPVAQGEPDRAGQKADGSVKLPCTHNHHVLGLTATKVIFVRVLMSHGENGIL